MINSMTMGSNSNCVAQRMSPEDAPENASNAENVADPKMIFNEAIKQKACSIILAHNHPSGNLSPSEQDKKLTEKVCKGGEYLDVRVLDHIIVCEAGYFSFADEGLM